MCLRQTSFPLLLLLLLFLVPSIFAFGVPRPDQFQYERIVPECPTQEEQGEPLFLTPYINSGEIEEAKQRSVAVYDNISLGFSGYFSVPSSSGVNTNNLFFWFAECLECDKATAPLFSWFQGGPGGDSTFGFMTEVGQYYIDESCEVQERCNSWCRHHHCLMFDQPVMTGHSFQQDPQGNFVLPPNVDWTNNSIDGGIQIHNALRQFFTIWPEYLPNPFWLAGESYGGNYVPAIAEQVLNNNTDPTINLVGLSVGDPIMNSVVQWPTYPSTFHGMGLVTKPQKILLQAVVDSGVEALLSGKSCRVAFEFWNSLFNDDFLSPEPWFYKKYTGSPVTTNQLLYEQPIEFDFYVEWIRSNLTAFALHYGGSPQAAPSHPSFYSDIYTEYVNSGDFCMNSSSIYARLFADHQINLNIYSSNVDPILGPPTTEAGVEAIIHEAAEILDDPKLPLLWDEAESNLWGVNSHNGIFGAARCIEYNSARLCFPVIRNAGHEAPAYQPRAALDMINRAFNNFPFDLKEYVPLPECFQCGGSGPFAGVSDCNCR